MCWPPSLKKQLQAPRGHFTCVFSFCRHPHPVESAESKSNLRVVLVAQDLQGACFASTSSSSSDCSWSDRVSSLPLVCGVLRAHQTGVVTLRVS